MKKKFGIVVLTLIAHLAAFGNHVSPVQNGVLDLRNHNWQKDGIVNVTGNWDFYWNKFYNPGSLSDTMLLHDRRFAFVPDFWNKYIPKEKFSHEGLGYATYHVKILCPSSSEPLALKLLTVQGAYRLFVNGKKAKEEGSADTTARTTVAKLQPAIIKVQPENNMLDIVMQVSNFNNYEGGLWDVVKIGTEEQIQAQTIKNLSFDFIISGVFLLAFIYNLIQFLYFRKQYALLFFSVLCLIIFIRILVTGEIALNYILSFNWEFIRRMEYISFYFSVPVISLFSYFLFPRDFSKKALYIILSVSIVFVIASLFGSYYIYTYIVRYYQGFMMVAALYGLYVYVKAAVKKRLGSYLFLIGFIIFLATIINDLLYVNLYIETVPLFYAGLAFFVLTLSVILSKQLAQAFFDLEIANRQLDEANKNLAIMNNDIQQKNIELHKINHELDIFVHRTSHDLRAPLSSVVGVTDLMQNETNLSALHDYAVLQTKTLERMDNLIKDIIDFSKNKRLNLTLEEINFAHIVNNSLEDHNHVKNAAQVHMQVDINQQHKFISDARRVSTIINNLVSNAIKYADLSKPKPVINININVTDNNAYIEVSDNGIGIDENKLGKIFTMFYRATSSATGSGLGLYIIKETVEKLNGTVSINSKAGEGTCVKVEIPDKSNEVR